MTDSEHYLSSFLSSRLPELGLDYETYGPYVVGALDGDEQELDEVVELLKASCETHGDDEESWQLLKQEIQEKQREYQQELQETLAKQREAFHRQEQERLKQDIQLAKNQPVEKKSIQLDAQQKALIERFAYEQEDDEGEEEAVVTNSKDVVAQASRPLENKAHQKSSKKEQQEATKQDRLQKQKLKEERRKRATKSERRR